jgi:alpha-beta hydrolase superfamily lysophospholipase
MADEASVEHVAARDGTAILVRRWLAASGEPWASILLVHGLAEHSGRYDPVGRHLATAGVETEAVDLRGFGGSGGPRASIDRWSQLHDDVEERLVALRAGAPSRPLVLYGHSLGGLVVLGYVLDGRARPDLLVLSAPAIDARIPLPQRLLVGTLGRLAPALRVPNGIDPAVLCVDEDVRAAYVDDPLCVHRTALRFGRAAFAEQRRVRRALDRLTVPTFVIHGGADRLIPTETSRILEGRPKVTRRVYPGLLHELHHEAAAPLVLDDVVRWIREQISRMPAPAATAPLREAGPAAAAERSAEAGRAADADVAADGGAAAETTVSADAEPVLRG